MPVVLLLPSWINNYEILYTKKKTGVTLLATPLTTPASSPCGTKYLSYSNIFFANFKEEQERILADKLKREQQQQQQQPTTRLRTNTRLCRETAINNNNNNNDCNSYTTMAMDYEQEQEEEEEQTSTTLMDNGNVQINETANILYEHNGDALANIDEELEEECSLKKHTINGTLYTSAANANTTTTTTVQSKKIRITENPLPEPVSC